MDSKLRCVFEMPNENDKLVSKKIRSHLSYFEINFASVFGLCWVCDKYYSAL